MRVEFRSSNQATACKECGSTSLLATSDGPSLQADLLEVTNQAFDRLERELVQLWEEEKVSLSEVVEQEKRDLEERLRKEYEQFEVNVWALLGERAPRFRVFRRRWQTHLEREYTRMIQELRSKTVRA